MVRVIKQETYDEVVKENIEDLAMTPQEAIEDAVKQFEAQGIDLTNIIKDLVITGENSNVIKNCLKKISTSLKDEKCDDITEVLEKLKTELDRDIARRMYAAKEMAYDILLDLIERMKNGDDLNILRTAIKTMTSLMTGHPDLLDDRGVKLQIELLDSQSDVPTIQTVLRWIKQCCIKHEMNRQAIFNGGILERMNKILQKEDKSDIELRDACGVLRSLTLDDDIRHEYGKAHEHASQMARALLTVLTELLKIFKEDEAVVGDLMLTMASLIVRNEFCQDVEDAGGLTYILDVMINYPDTEKLNWQALKLLKALAGNDNVKVHIVTNGSAPLIVSSIGRFKSSESVASAALSCISALTLRSSSNAGVFYDCGAPSIIIDAMKEFPKSLSVLRQGSWAIRNMSVRNKAESREFVAYGVDAVLRNAIKNHPVLAEDARAALRDLGLKVDLKEQWTGKGGALTHESF
ncbi:armadillo repeat-containing protein 6 homolog [Fopius arisanus]|uniref:Armadillo repeat-containing protein 6 homolog n=1 Tax=Fopius arisanus TaxID=64838 RepID=A0A9R1SWB4_9HYME|nr:PREDICTED: armadillo repeat-containing protein 6 homolog [Fopius arisanus]